MPTRLIRQQSLFILVLILLLATATRLHNIEERSLWADEGWTLDLGRGPTLPDVIDRMTHDVHPPLYFVIFNYWQDVAGDTEFGMRFLSLIFLSTLVDYVVGWQLGKQGYSERNRRLLLAVSVVFNLGLLGVFKYFDFFATSFTGLLGAFGMQADAATLNASLAESYVLNTGNTAPRGAASTAANACPMTMLSPSSGSKKRPATMFSAARLMGASMAGSMAVMLA